MISELFRKYRKIIEQAWIPIFVKDDFDTEILLRGCKLAGVKVIEYTLRRTDAYEVTQRLREALPDTVVLMGSTLDSVEIVNERASIFPQIMTLSELAPHVDGFVSMLPFSNETLEKYRDTHLCIPAAETGGEALRQVKHGAAFIKVLGPDFSFSKHLHTQPTFDYCPTYITGGITAERMSEAFSAGNILTASGFDVILKDTPPDSLTAELVAERIDAFVNAAKTARAEFRPSLRGCENLSEEEFKAALPNYCGIK